MGHKGNQSVYHRTFQFDISDVSLNLCPFLSLHILFYYFPQNEHVLWNFMQSHFTITLFTDRWKFGRNYCADYLLIRAGKLAVKRNSFVRFNYREFRKKTGKVWALRRIDQLCWLSDNRLAIEVIDMRLLFKWCEPIFSRADRVQLVCMFCPMSLLVKTSSKMLSYCERNAQYFQIVPAFIPHMKVVQLGPSLRKEKNPNT